MKEDNLQNSNQDIIKSKPSEANLSQLPTKAKSDRSFLTTPIKPGVILKDASNPAPGYGLWCTNIPKNQSGGLKVIDELFEKYNIENPGHIESQTNIMIIDQLKYQCQDLNTKLINSISGYYENENRALNAEKMQKEYEEIINTVEEEKYQLEIHNHQLEETIGNLTSALSNTQKEIKRLLEVVESNKAYVIELNNQFEAKLANEQKKQQEMKDKITALKKEIHNLTNVEQELKLKKQKSLILSKSKVEPYSNSNNLSNSNPIKEELQAKILSELILKLQLQIADLKKTLREYEEEKKALNEVIKFKEYKNNNQRKSIDNLCAMMEEKDRLAYWNKIVLKEKTVLLNNYKARGLESTAKEPRNKFSFGSSSNY